MRDCPAATTGFSISWRDYKRAVPRSRSHPPHPTTRTRVPALPPGERGANPSPPPPPSGVPPPPPGGGGKNPPPPSPAERGALGARENSGRGGGGVRARFSSALLSVRQGTSRSRPVCRW